MCAALTIIVISIIIIIVVLIYQKSTNAICLSRRRLNGKTVLVTGGTAGMGLEIATDLAHRGAKVIVACPFKDEGMVAQKQIIDSTDNEKVIFKVLDLGSLESVRKFAAEILNTEERLDILINNAGVGVPNEFLTSDEMNFIMQVNYYGTFLLTLLLLPLLKKTGKTNEPSRIITTSSVLHMIGKIDIENFNKVNYYWFTVQVYANSKICLVLFARELAKRLKGSNVVINSIDPGAVGTRIFDSLNVVMGTIIRIMFNSVLKTPWQGSQTALHVALDGKAGTISGAYFKNCEIGSFVRSSDEKTMSRLWEHSLVLVKLSDSELEQCFRSM